MGVGQFEPLTNPPRQRIVRRSGLLANFRGAPSHGGVHVLISMRGCGVATSPHLQEASWLEVGSFVDHAGIRGDPLRRDSSPSPDQGVTIGVHGAPTTPPAEMLQGIPAFFKVPRGRPRIRYRFRRATTRTCRWTGQTRRIGSTQVPTLSAAARTTRSSRLSRGSIGAPGAIISGQGINDYAFTQQAKDVTIEYLTIKDFGKPGDNNNQGVVNHDAGSNWTIENNTISRTMPAPA